MRRPVVLGAETDLAQIVLFLLIEAERQWKDYWRHAARS
jgi:hypothetical protein